VTPPALPTPYRSLVAQAALAPVAGVAIVRRDPGDRFTAAADTLRPA
jgi:hypothetical protein